MKTKTATKQILIVLLGLCLISIIIIIISQTEGISQKRKLARETKVFFWYADSINVKVPEEHHTFILIPDASCKGCVQAAINEWCNTLENTTFIVTGNIAKAFINDDSYQNNLHIDTMGLMNYLNWELGNIIRIETEAEKVVLTKSYSVDDMF